MKSITTQRSISEITAMLAKITLSIVVTTGVIGAVQTNSAIATPSV
ncbi:hypothetical protein [Gloeocapsopsis sp. IPPAS B-1203]|nr:hypothetical protein [Gloeocapsopsis sp. IPPAS B-1203]